MDKKGISQVVVMFVIMAVVALVLIYSLRVIPEEGLRQQTCQAHLGFCYEEGTTCPLGTNRIDYDCTDEKPCCIGTVRESTPTSPSTSGTPPAAGTTPPAEPDAAEERRSISELQTRLEAARREGNLEQISAGYDAAKALIIARFEQYRSPTSSPMTRENTPFNYNTVKSFEQLTLAAEAAFRVANQDRKTFAASQDYFKWMCRDWLLLTRAHLLGYYEESTYNLDNWLANKERVFSDYAAHVGTSRPCEVMRPITRTTDFTICKDSWSDEAFRTLALAQETPDEEVWGSCYIFRSVLGQYPLLDFEETSFSIGGADFFLPRTPQQIFTEESS